MFLGRIPSDLLSPIFCRLSPDSSGPHSQPLRGSAVGRSGRRVPFCLLSSVFCLLFLSSAAVSEAAGPATLRGLVIDSTGQPVSEAIVVARSAAGVARETRTGRDGRYELARLDPGRYEVQAFLDGFRGDIAQAEITARSPLEVILTLRPAAVTETLVVSASYVETPLSRAPGSVSVLSGREIEARQIATINGALTLFPGAATAASGGPGAITSLFSRGGESDFTLVVVDGVKLNAFGGGIDLGHLTTAGLETFEQLRGPQSAVVGADAIGGVIQLRTALGGPRAASASFESGGMGTNRLVAGTTGTAGRVAWGANVERWTSDGWTANAPGTANRVGNDDYAATNLAVAASLQAAPGTSVRLDARIGENERGYPGPFGSDPIGAFPGIDLISRGRNTLALGSLTLTHEITAATAIRLQGSWSDQRADFASPWGSSLARTQRWTAKGQIDRALSSSISASAGIDVQAERADSTHVVGADGGRMPVERRNTGYFGELRIRAADRLFVTGGLRLEDIRRSALEADPFGYPPRPALAAEGVLSANPRVSGSYYVRTSDEARGNWSRIHVSAGTGIRTPDAFEIAFTDNPNLKPERSRSLDAGFEQALAGGLVVAGVTAFANRFDNLIVAVGGSLGGVSRYRTDNIANARSRGVEVSASLRLPQGLQLRASYTRLDSEVLAVDNTDRLAPAPFDVGDPLIRRPRHQGALDLLCTRGRLTTFFRAGGRGEVLDVEPNWGAYGGLFTAPGYVVADAGIAWRLARAIEVFARSENLFDRQYEAAFGYPAPRRTFTTGVRVAAGR